MAAVLSAETSTAAVSIMNNILTPGSTFGGEKFRGLLTSAVSGVTANLLNFVGMKYMGLSVQISSIVFLQILGNILGYALDILFAKSQFRIRNYRGAGAYEGPIPYRELGTRIRWLARSFFSKQFYRFIVTVIIDTLVSLAILNWTIKAFDAKHFLSEWKYRNFVLAGLTAVATFFLYVNILRFDWAYSDSDVPMFNVIVLMWVTMVLMIYAVTYKPPTQDAGENTKSGNKAETNSLDNKFTPVVLLAQ
jgi:hypothetical protein